MPTQLIGQGQGGTCVHCGAPLEADAMFCIVCGRQVERGKTRAVDSNPVPVGTCTNCGAPLEAGAQFCVVCGTPTSGGAAQVPTGGQGVSGVGSTCPSCGWPLEPGALYCISCGVKVDAAAAEKPRQQGFVPNGDGMAYADGAVWTSGETINLGAGSGAGAGGGVGMRQWNVGGGAGGASGPITPIPAPISGDDDDDASVRPQLVMLTDEECRRGCVKRVKVSKHTNETIEVNIPAGVNVTTKLDVPGYGNLDSSTGRRGPLRLSFYIG